MPAERQTDNNQPGSSPAAAGRFPGLPDWRRNSELEQALLRLVITVISLVYLLLVRPESGADRDLWQLRMEVVVAFLAYSMLFLASILRWPAPSGKRRAIGVLGDIGITSVALYLAGPTGAPWYGVYLWVTLGNGFRYGEKFLYFSGAASLIGFAAVVVATPYWHQQKELAFGLAATLLLIPAYAGILIRRLKEARARADAASRAKSDFLSRMSHEIRTPLNGILGMTDLLRTRPLGAEEREYVETIHASGTALACQIDDILDLSKIEAGRMSLETVEFDLHALISTSLRIFESQVANKRIQLQESIDPETPFLLCGDPHKLRQLIMNLVGNAVKFTEHGFVSLRVYPRDRDASRVTLRFEVADTGRGIAEEHLQHIFEPFTQADSSISRSHGGTGLGTAICKQLVELMGGEIGVRSTLDVGTTFWFDIPFEVAESADGEQAWVEACHVAYLSAGEQEGEVAGLLREWGMPFTRIHTLEEARTCLGPAGAGLQGYSAVLIDNLPYDERLQHFLSGLPGRRVAGHAAVVVLGSERYPPEVTRHENDHLFALGNPVDKGVLFNTLHACHSQHSSADDVVHIARRQVRTQAAQEPLEILVGDDNATNRMVLERMLSKMGHHCTTVDGGEAVLHALERGRYDVAIVDRNMPDMSGLDVFSAYNMAHGGKGSTRFVILTADATRECRDACMNAGIEFFMTKPVSLASLQEVLTELTPLAEPVPAAASTGAAEAPLVDEDVFAKLRLLAGDDADFMDEIVANFEKDARNDLRNLEAAVATRDWNAFRDAAHALKGAAMYLGLQQLVELALESQNLERERFEREGIERLRSLQQAIDSALRALQQRLQDGAASPGYGNHRR
ncbi:MAG TPA: response regulator [Gammaproteobacteria bacterium]|nr:response regulator [Gammaproteobacteria bacterium]